MRPIVCGDMGPIEGCVDQWDGQTFRGWVWSPENADLALSIEAITDGGRVLARAVANRFRSDLLYNGKGDGRCAYELRLPGDLPAQEIGLRIRAGDQSCEIEGRYNVVPRVPQPLSIDLHLRGMGNIGGLIDRVGDYSLFGWAHGPGDFDPPVTLELWEGDTCIASGRADLWRNDMEDMRQGNGQVGFDIPFPDALYDGQPHTIDVRNAENGISLLYAPLEIELGDQPPIREAPPVQDAAPAAPWWRFWHKPVTLSIVVNFYNMRREAARTLTSLTRGYQQDIGNLAYEVICVDNGSDPPLDADWIASFGPEFRLFRPSNPDPSPVFALNAAAALARGRYVAMMIDGAHILSPRVLVEAMQALREQPGTIVALRHWFVGGDQRWLSQIGYTRAHEDILFSRIEWPADGYRLFAISSPIFESPNHWIDELAESNCLFLSRQAYDALGGFDEAFSMPGAGFANLDLFTRAARAPGASVVALIGEATFHQFHGGTTTNVSDARKEVLVREYAGHYQRLRGHAFRRVGRSDIRLRGKISADLALTGRQRPSVKAALGLADTIRPAELAAQFDHGARQYLRSVYVETGMRDRTIWTGQPTGVAPADLVEIQQMLWTVRPERLVLKNVTPGLAAFILSILPSVQLEGMRIIGIEHPDEALPPGIDRIEGFPMDSAVLARVEELVDTAETVCVLFQPRPEDSLPVEALQRFSRFVSPGGYMVVLNSAVGQPELGYSRQWTQSAIARFLKSGAPFVVDPMMGQHFITTCPSGFLLRLPDVYNRRGYAAALDQLEDL